MIIAKSRDSCYSFSGVFSTMKIDKRETLEHDLLYMN